MAAFKHYGLVNAGAESADFRTRMDQIYRIKKPDIRGLFFNALRRLPAVRPTLLVLVCAALATQFASATPVQAATITLVAATSSGSAAAVTSITINKPAGVLPTHLMLAQITVRGNITITAPGG